MYRNVQTSEKISISRRSVSLSSEFRNRGINYLFLSFQLKQYSQLVPYQHRWCFISECCRSAYCLFVFISYEQRHQLMCMFLLHITQMWPWIWLVSQFTCHWGLGTTRRRASNFVSRGDHAENKLKWKKLRSLCASCMRGTNSKSTGTQHLSKVAPCDWANKFEWTINVNV